jgi:FkbM family methyltransferase
MNAQFTFANIARHLSRPIVVFDIGCRGGFAPQWDDLGSSVHLVGFDADEEEVAALRERYAERGNVKLVSATLGRDPHDATLYVTRNPVGFSVIQPDHQHSAHFVPSPGADIVGTKTVKVTTLSSWAKELGIRAEAVDSLKLDTQGSELEILEGAGAILSETRHIEIEVSFNETSRGAPLHGEIDTFLRRRGFALWRFRDLAHYALNNAVEAAPMAESFWYDDGNPRAETVSLPGGQLVWCNAHYVRREMYDPNRRLDWEARLRDACLAAALSFNDLAMLALNRLRDEGAPPEVASDLDAAIVVLREQGVRPKSRLEARLAEALNEIETIKETLSWRITSPLRTMRRLAQSKSVTARGTRESSGVRSKSSGR